MQTRSRRFVSIGAVVAATAMIAGVATASVPDASGVIHGCYNAKLTTLRVIDPSTGQKCLANLGETALDWNQTGPAGVAGAKGDTGPSAYDLWLAAGHAGTVDDFLASLVGPAGAKGDKGDPGSALASVEALSGVACRQGTPFEGTLTLSYDYQNELHLVCRPSGKAHVVINEVATQDIVYVDLAAAVELYNSGNEAIDVSGWTLVWEPGPNGAEVQLKEFAAGTTLAEHQYVVVSGSEAPGADPAVLQSWWDGGGGVQLRDQHGTPVDSMAYGFPYTETYVFAETAQAETGLFDYRRCPNGHDSDNNRLDFPSSVLEPSLGSANGC